MTDDTYMFHQTPYDCARDLLQYIDFEDGDKVIEPFRGEGAFYNQFPDNVNKDWAEIREGKDYRDIANDYDWVITNPPFKLQIGTKKVNTFWFLLDHFTQHARKGVAFLGNDYCLGTLTPKRLEILKARGWNITKCVVCSIKKWRGRYFFCVFEKKQGFFHHLLTNY